MRYGTARPVGQVILMAAALLLIAAVSAGGNHTCRLDADGIATCWGASGDADKGQADPPDGSSIAISAGYEHTCARMGGRYAGAATRTARAMRHPASTPPSPPETAALAPSPPPARRYVGAATNTVKPMPRTAHSPPSPPAANIPAPCVRTASPYAGTMITMDSPPCRPAGMPSSARGLPIPAPSGRGTTV